MVKEIVNTFNSLSNIQLIVCSAAICGWLIRLIHLFLITGKVALKKQNKRENVVTNSVSVLLTVRNEEENIKHVLPQLLGCGGQKFELIAVDDYSQDSTLTVLGMLKQKFGRLKISTLSQETRYSEKLSQNIALKSAQNDWVLIMTSGFENIGKEWLESFQQKTEDKIGVKIGYVAVANRPGWYNILYRIENFFLQLRSFGYTNTGVAFVYSEENVAFKRQEYFKLGGYGQNIKEPYANLELIINSFLKKNHCEFIFNPAAITVKKMEINRNEFLNLLKKSIRIEKHLPLWKRIFLQFDRITEVLFLPLMFLVLMMAFNLWSVVLLLVVLKLVIYMFIIKISQNRLNERKIFITSLVFSFIMPFYKLVFRWHFNRKSRSQKWKNKG